MLHFGLCCPCTPGHFNPMASLGRELIDNGHKVTYFSGADGESLALAQGVEFWMLDSGQFPKGTMRKQLDRFEAIGELEGFFYTVEQYTNANKWICQYAPAAFRAAGVNALLIDQTDIASASVAEALGLPFVTICNALPLNQESKVPPWVTDWDYSQEWWSQLRNQAVYLAGDLLSLFTLLDPINRFREANGLTALTNLESAYSRLAQLCQLPREFDFPREHLPAHFYYTGPWRDQYSKQSDTLPCLLDDRPLVYASLGTVQNRKHQLFFLIAEACKDLPIQLVIAHGGALSPQQVAALPGNPLALEWAPQVPLIARAALVVTHCGLNTVLDALEYGVPMVAIPLMHEQPAIGARLQRAGVARILPTREQTTAIDLRNAIQTVLQNEDFTGAARHLREAIRQSGGVSLAVQVIEQAVAKKTTVVSFSGGIK